MTNEASTLLDSDASNKAADADAALQELGADHVGQAYVTATVTVWDEDPALAAKNCVWSRRSSRAATSPCVVEGVNAVEAWLGSLPGHVYANVRHAANLHAQLGPHDPLSAVSGRAGTGRTLCRAPAVLCADRRLDPVPVFASCR